MDFKQLLFAIQNQKECWGKVQCPATIPTSGAVRVKVCYSPFPPYFQCVALREVLRRLLLRACDINDNRCARVT